jgi:hypothetical protein
VIEALVAQCGGRIDSRRSQRRQEGSREPNRHEAGGAEDHHHGVVGAAARARRGCCRPRVRAAGQAASVWASRLVGSRLFGIEPRDPATFIGAAGVLALVGLLAGVVPAWCAARVDPTTVMRSL